MKRKSEEIKKTKKLKISKVNSSNDEEEKNKKRLLIILIILLLLLLLGGIFGFFIYKNYLKNKNAQNLPQNIQIEQIEEIIEPVLYNLNVSSDLKGGKIVFNKTQACAGETIQVQIIADEGKIYKDKSFILTVNGTEIVVKNGEFLMPEGDIFAFAIFENSLDGIFIDPKSYLHGTIELKKDDDGKVLIDLTPHRGYKLQNLTVTDEKTEGNENHFTFIKNAERDVTILATWEEIEYSLTYDLAGGEFVSQNEEILQNYTISTQSYNLPLAQKVGYNFLGWIEKSSPKKAVKNIPSKTTGNLQFTALWKAIPYKISYNNLQNASFNKISTYTIEDFFTLPNAFRQGYDFLGWFITNEALDESDNKPITAIAKGSSGELDFYARWMPKEYTLTYNLNGGKIEQTENLLKTYTISQNEYALPRPIKDGYNFIGWELSDNPNKNEKNKKYFSIKANTAENLNFSACWQAKNYKISLYNENGKKVFEEFSYNIENQTKLPKLNKNGYVFLGWAEGQEKNAKAYTEFPKGNFGDKKLYAKFKPVDYTITMHLYGSALNENKQKFLYNREMEDFLLPIPYREGWDFAGWYSDFERQNADVALIKQGSEGNKDFYADWTCTVYFNGNGGEDCESITLNSKKPFIADLPMASRDYYNFDGWFYDKECTKKFDSKNALKGNTTLYANWQPVYFSIQYQANGGEMPSSYLREYTVESVQNSLPIPQKEGWAFAGWYADSGFKTPIQAAFSTEQAQSKDLFARKMKDSSNFSNVSNSFENTADFSKNYSLNKTNTSNLSPLYAMDSLYEINEPVDVKVDLSSDITLFAKWFKFNTKIIPKGKYIRSDKSPSLETIPHDLEVSTTEITRNVYQTVMGIDPSDDNYSTFSNEEEKMENPVQMVSWFDALVFCNKLSILNGVQPVYKIKGSTNPADWGEVPINNNLDWMTVEWDKNANGFRLPTEQEWMWAAMSGPLVASDLDKNGVNTQGWKKKFAGQNLQDAKVSSKLIKNYAWFSNNAKSKTHPAGLALANEAGLVDMSGNVWEWCWDAFMLYGDESAADVEGSGINTGEAYRAIRGGSWYSFPSYMRVNARLSLNIYGRNQLTGFRVVRTVNKTSP